MNYLNVYQEIQNLEQAGLFPAPEPQDTVTVGIIDPAKGTFAWSVPIIDQTLTTPPPVIPRPNPHPTPEPAVKKHAAAHGDTEGKSALFDPSVIKNPDPIIIGPGPISNDPDPINTITNITVGVAGTKAVDLLLKFAVVPIPIGPPVTKGNESAKEAKTTETEAHAGVTIGGKGGLITQSNGGVTIDGFPTVSSTATEITIDAGLVCSQLIGGEDVNISPPVTTFPLVINIPQAQKTPLQIRINIMILRPPVVGGGVFTIPALPMTIVYAPPQGPDLKNTSTYSSTETFTRSVTTSMSSGSATKTAQAYSASELLGKVAGAITAVVAVVGSGGTAVAGGASVAGAFAELGQAIFGPVQPTTDSTSDAVKEIGTDLSSVSSLLGDLDSSTGSDTSAVTTGSGNSLTLSLASLASWTADNTLGPGAGDRVVVLLEVKMVWMAVNGEVGICVLGYAGIDAIDMADLQTAISAGTPYQFLDANGNAVPGLAPLDLPTMESLVALDPYLAPRHAKAIFEPRIGPPRFIPATSLQYGPEYLGSGAAIPPGDIITVTYESTTDDQQVTTSSDIVVTDYKPGSLSVFLGSTDTETTSTTTMTTSQTTDTKDDVKTVCTLVFGTLPKGPDDSYAVKFFYDNAFGTYLAVDAASSALQGIVPPL